MDSTNPAIDCLQSIDLSLPGAPRTVEHCLSVAKLDFLREFPNIIYAAQVRGFNLTDDRWWLLAAFVFCNNPVILIDEYLRQTALLYSANPATFLGEALVRVVEYCWFDVGDCDAVEYHYWACLQLVKRFCENAEALILDRLSIQNDPIKRGALIYGIGVLTHEPLLHCLRPATVAVVINLLTEHHEPLKVSDVAREVLVEDILRADREQAFLIPNHRREIESLIR